MEKVAKYVIIIYMTVSADAPLVSTELSSSTHHTR